MSFLPDTSILLAYSITCFVLFITPGPDMSLFLAKTVAGGSRAGLASMLGAQVGCTVHTVLAALGLSALLATSPKAFLVLKLIGGFYLLWLAVDAIRNGSALNIKEGPKTKARFWPTFWLGAGVNLTNPKVVLFFVTFLPQFVQASDPHASQKLFFLGLYYILFSIPLAVILILGAERVLALLATRPRLLRGIDFTFAGLFGVFAIKILTTEGR